MSETVTQAPPPVGARYEAARKSVRKSPPPSFPHRLTVCFAPDQIENLQQVKKAFRCSESFAIRMAFDAFCRNNGFPINGGGNNGR
jgi:hypothetical protein